MTDELEPLPADVFKVLEVERARPEVPADQVARLASRLEATLAPSPPRGEGPASLLKGKAAMLAVGLAVGAIGGAQLQKNFGEPREVIVEKRVEVPIRVEVQVPVEVEVPARKPLVAQVAPHPDPLPASQGEGAQQVRAPIELERLLIEQASSALGRGQGADALAACAEHVNRFPAGQLAEEREIVAIRALVLLGQKAGAASRAEDFRKKFPESLLLDVVNEAVR
ncbi:MAG: hypothetical protein Q8K32_27850 [Archangium sp.]|nr:hypothetical protein [Archangium sp.]